MSLRVPHHQLTNELAELAALFALGLLDPDQAQDFEHHLSAGCRVCSREVEAVRETAALVAFRARPISPPLSLKSRVIAAVRQEQASGASPQVWKSWTPSMAASLHVVRHGEGEWQTVRPGVHVKKLFADPERDSVTMLIRMEPGATWVPHRHAGPEQCFVLEGDVREGGDVFHAGDFQCAVENSVHGVQWTEKGCLLLINCSQHDEIIR